MVADHPYLACAVALLLGLVAGWFAGQLTQLRRAPHPDDDITGIGA